MKKLQALAFALLAILALPACTTVEETPVTTSSTTTTESTSVQMEPTSTTTIRTN